MGRLQLGMLCIPNEPATARTDGDSRRTPMSERKLWVSVQRGWTVPNWTGTLSAVRHFLKRGNYLVRGCERLKKFELGDK